MDNGGALILTETQEEQALTAFKSELMRQAQHPEPREAGVEPVPETDAEGLKAAFRAALGTLGPFMVASEVWEHVTHIRRERSSGEFARYATKKEGGLTVAVLVDELEPGKLQEVVDELVEEARQ